MWIVDWTEIWEDIYGNEARLVAFRDGSASVIDEEGYEHPYPTYDSAFEKLSRMGFR